MPPLSPVPGWARGDVWKERTASRRTTSQTLPSGSGFPRSRIVPGRLADEGLVDAQQGLLLLLGEQRVAQDGHGHVLGALPLLQDAGPDVERLGRDAQRLGDLLEDVGRRLAQAALDLAQVRV